MIIFVCIDYWLSHNHTNICAAPKNQYHDVNQIHLVFSFPLADKLFHIKIKWECGRIFMTLLHHKIHPYILAKTVCGMLTSFCYKMTALVQVVSLWRSRKSKQKKKNMLQYYPHMKWTCQATEWQKWLSKKVEKLLSTMGRGEMTNIVCFMLSILGKYSWFSHQMPSCPLSWFRCTLLLVFSNDPCLRFIAHTALSALH